MANLSKQDKLELLTTSFIEACKQYDTSSLLKYHVSMDDARNHMLDTTDVTKLVASAVAIEDRGLKYGASISYDGWSFFFGNLVFSVLSGDSESGDLYIEAENIAKLFIDLCYKRITAIYYVSDISADNAYDFAQRKINRTVRVAQYYLKKDGYHHLATSLPYTKWLTIKTVDGERLEDEVRTDEIIAIDTQSSSGAPFNSSVDLLRKLDFPFSVHGLERGDITSLSDLKPVNQTVWFTI